MTQTTRVNYPMCSLKHRKCRNRGISTSLKTVNNCYVDKGFEPIREFGQAGALLEIREADYRRIGTALQKYLASEQDLA